MCGVSSSKIFLKNFSLMTYHFKKEGIFGGPTPIFRFFVNVVCPNVENSEKTKFM